MCPGFIYFIHFKGRFTYGYNGFTFIAWILWQILIKFNVPWAYTTPIIRALQPVIFCYFNHGSNSGVAGDSFPTDCYVAYSFIFRGQTVFTDDLNVQQHDSPLRHPWFWYDTQWILVWYTTNFGMIHNEFWYDTQPILVWYTTNFGTIHNELNTLWKQ
jgi:hypothetical protein